MDISRLIYLVNRKNDINRRRRRFYYYMHFNEQYRFEHVPAMHRKEKHISEATAKIGYEKAKADMKAMTSIMREMRKEIGATFEWSDGGHILAVIYEGARIHHGEFKNISDNYLADRIILGG